MGSFGGIFNFPSSWQLFSPLISLESRLSLKNFLPSSGTNAAAVGRMYFGHKGLTTLLERNSLALGLAPSMSSTNSGLELLLSLWMRSGMGST